eukprot:scaffold8014_cov248-Pinguiococcus_pyrenoidosus.AAC.1
MSTRPAAFSCNFAAAAAAMKPPMELPAMTTGVLSAFATSRQKSTTLSRHMYWLYVTLGFSLCPNPGRSNARTR